MGFEVRIKEIILEIEYLLLIMICISGISDRIFNYLDKYYICLLFVIFHELSHVFIGSLLNKKLSKLFIGISGMTAFFRYDFKNKDVIYYLKECFIFLAGPLSNIIIAVCFKDIKFIYEINIFLALLNLLPIYPLDGFNILKNILSIIFIKNKRFVNSIIKVISLLFLLAISILCVVIFLKVKNIFSIIFLLYLLLINIQNK